MMIENCFINQIWKSISIVYILILNQFRFLFEIYRTKEEKKIFFGNIKLKKKCQTMKKKKKEVKKLPLFLKPFFCSTLILFNFFFFLLNHSISPFSNILQNKLNGK